jgi:polysaccharide export outer membrane protein
MKKLFLLFWCLVPPCALSQNPAGEVKLGPGDTIEIRLFYSPELNKLQIIRPDGKILMQLIGEVTAAGKTPGELTRDLTARYKKYFAQLDVAVFVESYANRTVYVGGEVAAPGEIELFRQLTLLEAVMRAGGINSTTGSYRNVVVLRLQENRYVRYEVNLEEVLLGREKEPFYLLPLDIVYVPARLYSP